MRENQCTVGGAVRHAEKSLLKTVWTRFLIVSNLSRCSYDNSCKFIWNQGKMAEPLWYGYTDRHLVNNKFFLFLTFAWKIKAWTLWKKLWLRQSKIAKEEEEEKKQLLNPTRIWWQCKTCSYRK